MWGRWVGGCWGGVCRQLQARTYTLPSCTFPCLSHNNLIFDNNNYNFNLLWNKQGKLRLLRVPDLACSTLGVWVTKKSVYYSKLEHFVEFRSFLL